MPNWTNYWRQLSVFLLPVRMPLFFLVAGILAYRAVNRSWKVLFRTRVSDLIWPYVTWTMLIGLFWSVRLNADGAELAPTLVGAFAFGGAHLWFLTTLTMFLVLSKLAARIPLAALFAAALVAFWLRPILLAYLDPYVPADLHTNIGRWMIYLVWFMLGCFARSAVLWLVSKPWTLALVSTVALFVFALADELILSEIRIPLISISGIAALLAWSALAARFAFIRRLSEYLAGRTLAIYVGHAFLLELFAAVILASRKFDLDVQVTSTIFAIFFVPLVTAAVVIISTWFYDRCTSGSFYWIFQPPWRKKLVLQT